MQRNRMRRVVLPPPSLDAMIEARAGIHEAWGALRSASWELRQVMAADALGVPEYLRQDVLNVLSEIRPLLVRLREVHEEMSFAVDDTADALHR